MEAIESLLLGIVQGLTEFLPVSSSGHLVIAEALLGAETGGGIVFEVAVHVATLVAILLFYRLRVWALTIGALRGDGGAWRYLGKLIVATLPTVIAALLARDWIERQFDSPGLAGVCLLVTGGIVWSTRYTLLRGQRLEPTWLAALAIGCAQTVAILPGISRSGSTLAVGLVCGLAPLAAAEFSFLLGMIAMAGAGVLLLPDLGAVGGEQWRTISFAAAAALVSGLIALWLFVWLLRGRRFHLFAWYAWAVGALTLIWLGLMPRPA